MDGKWPRAWLLLGPFLGAPVWSSRLFPSPPLGWDVICQGCFTGAHRTRALCSEQLTLRVQRQQGLKVSNAFVRGVEDAARVPLALQAQGDGAEHVPPSASRCPGRCWIPAPSNPLPASPERCKTRRSAGPRPWGSAQGQRVPSTGWLCSFLPPPAWFPKVFPYRYFFLLAAGVTQHGTLVPQFPLAVLSAVSWQGSRRHQLRCPPVPGPRRCLGPEAAGARLCRDRGCDG